MNDLPLTPKSPQSITRTDNFVVNCCHIVAWWLPCLLLIEEAFVVTISGFIVSKSALLESLNWCPLSLFLWFDSVANRFLTTQVVVIIFIIEFFPNKLAFDIETKCNLKSFHSLLVAFACFFFNFTQDKISFTYF